jgi:hypothetical protein
VQTSPVVGRDSELRVLHGLIDGVRGSPERVLLLAGEAGIGKTRLLHEGERHARGAGLLVAWGVAWDGGGAPAYWPLLRALRALAACVHGEQARALQLAAAQLAAPAAENASFDDEERRFRTLEGVADALAALSASQAVLLILDDLHAADRATLSALHFLTRALRATPLLWLLAYRQEEARADAHSARTLAEIAREGRTLALGRLAQSQLRELLCARGQGDPGDAETARLFASSLGNPLFALELLALPIEPGTSPKLPDTVRELIAGRIARLSAEAQATLRAAAVLGTELSLAALAGVLELHVEVALERLREPIRAGFVLDSGGTQARFAHPLFREALLASLDAEQRLRLHGAAARTLERLRKSGVPVALGEIAHHLLAAGDAGTAREAVRVTLEAAESELRTGAYDHAARLLEQALRACLLFPADAGTRIDLLLLLAEALARAGERERGREAAASAAEHARNSEDASRLARAALAYGAEFETGAVDPRHLQLLEEARGALEPGASALRALVTARLGAAMVPGPRGPEGARLAAEALELARSTCEKRELLRVMLAAGSASIVDWPIERVVELDRETAALAIELHERGAALRSHARLTVDCWLLGDLLGAESAHAQHQRLAAQLPYPQYRGASHLLTAGVAALRGRFAEALAESERAREIADASADASLQRSVYLQRMVLLRDAGDAQALRAHRDRLTGSGGVFGDPTFAALVRAAQSCWLGDGERARAEVSALPLDHPMLSVEFTSLILATDIVAQLRARDAAQRLLAIVERATHRYCTWGRVGCAWEGPVARLRALLCDVLGDQRAALRLLDAAIVEAEQMGLPPTALRLRLDRVRIAGAASDEQHAELRAIAAQAGALGMIGLAAAARALELSPPTETTPPHPGVATVAPLIELELQGAFWRVRGRGREFLLKDSRGLQLLARMIDAPEHEFHVLELASDAPAGSAPSAADLGDAGELLDDTAKQAYRARLRELAVARSEAERDNDSGRLERLDQELRAIESELSRATGLSGRDRRAAAAAERARVNVQRRLRDAIERIAEQDPELGAHLTQAVRTGIYCVYRPRARSASGGRGDGAPP